MKKIILLVSLLPILANSQNLNLEETTKYINNKIENYALNKGIIQILSDGEFIHEESFSSFSVDYFKFNLNKMLIEEVVTIQNSEEIYPREIGKFKVLICCTNNSECVKYITKFKKDNTTQTKYFPCYYLYFNDLEEAKTVRKAFIHAQSITKKYSDPFK